MVLLGKYPLEESLHGGPGFLVGFLIVFQRGNVELFTELVGLNVGVTMLDTYQSDVFEILTMSGAQSCYGSTAVD